jgi:hypothetical protein
VDNFDIIVGGTTSTSATGASIPHSSNSPPAPSFYNEGPSSARVVISGSTVQDVHLRQQHGYRGRQQYRGRHRRWDREREYENREEKREKKKERSERESTPQTDGNATETRGENDLSGEQNAVMDDITQSATTEHEIEHDRAINSALCSE